jgi:hypothetical protein
MLNASTQIEQMRTPGNRLEALRGAQRGRWSVRVNDQWRITFRWDADTHTRYGARLNELIRGKRGITAETALKLAKLLKTDAEWWMALQAQHDLWHAQQALQRSA